MCVLHFSVRLLHHTNPPSVRSLLCDLMKVKSFLSLSSYVPPFHVLTHPLSLSLRPYLPPSYPSGGLSGLQSFSQNIRVSFGCEAKAPLPQGPQTNRV